MGHREGVRIERAEMVTGVFLRRLNRFVVECTVSGRPVRAHLPNPGRLWELLLPGRIVYLADHGAASGRITSYTAIAVVRDEVPVLLHTQMTNGIARTLLESGRIRGLETARIVRQEVTFDNSRFDFLLEKEKEEIIVEVKSCTLFGRHMAMFPDAVTERGRRHLEHLAELAGRGKTCGVLFVVHSPHVSFFLPDYHTDLAFARAFLSLREHIFYRAVAVSWQRDLSIGTECREMEIPWNILEREIKDRGSYLLHLSIPGERDIDIGGLGLVHIRRGHYLYVGSARKNLSARLERHLRRRKKFFWHIDYLRDHAASCHAIPIRTGDDIEHELAASLAPICDWTIPRFGSSDCSCGSHLFGMEENPLHTPRFIELLQYFRMDRLTTADDLL